MIVRTERTTAHGEKVVETYGGNRYVHPPHSRPSLDGKKLLGRPTAVIDIDGGRITLRNPDGDLRSYDEIETIKLPPMISKIRLEFTSLSPKTVNAGGLIGIEHANDETPNSSSNQYGKSRTNSPT